MSAEDLEQAIREQTARSDELQLRLLEVVGEAASPDRAVSVRVGPTGVPTDLLISERALSMSGTRLSQTILDCLRRAGADAGARTRELVAELFGDRVDIDALLPPTDPPARP